jgi:hypothetical protein
MVESFRSSLYACDALVLVDETRFMGSHPRPRHRVLIGQSLLDPD